LSLGKLGHAAASSMLAPADCLPSASGDKSEKTQARDLYQDEHYSPARVDETTTHRYNAVSADSCAAKIDRSSIVGVCDGAGAFHHYPCF
jgi:hypothetical protein